MFLGHAWKNVRWGLQRHMTFGVRGTQKHPHFPSFPPGCLRPPHARKGQWRHLSVELRGRSDV
jgi:hypothetical protein